MAENRGGGGAVSTKSKATSSSCLGCKALVDTEFESLPRDEVAVLDGAKVTRLYQAGETVYREGESSKGMYCIGAGTICIRKKDQRGEAVPLRMKYAGQTMGVRTFVAGGSHDGTAVVVDQARVCFVEGDTVRALFSRNVNMALSFLNRLAADLDKAEGRILERRSVPARSRLARLLLDLFAHRGTVGTTGEIVLRLPFARRELSAVLGTSVSTMSRLIRDFQRQGIARFSGDRVSVDRLSDLLAVAQTTGRKS